MSERRFSFITQILSKVRMDDESLSTASANFKEKMLCMVSAKNFTLTQQALHILQPSFNRGELIQFKFQIILLSSEHEIVRNLAVKKAAAIESKTLFDKIKFALSLRTPPEYIYLKHEVCCFC